MPLTRKIVCLFLGINAILFAVSLSLAGLQTRDDLLDELRREYTEYLFNTSNELDAWYDFVEDDLRALSQDPRVTVADDSRFTSFLDADPQTFRYRYTQAELDLIALFAAYRRTHPMVNSIYMGRENGSFVRSHPRSSPTRYDPRIRPWYRAAMDRPDEVVYTGVYSSLTNSDVNVGMVLTLRRDGAPYGVIGMDITLDTLAARLNEKILDMDGYFELWDRTGTILVSRNPVRLRQNGFDDNYAQLDRYPGGRIESGEGFYRFMTRLAVTDGYLSAFVSQRDFDKRLGALLRRRFTALGAILLALLCAEMVLLELVLFRPIREISQALAVSAKNGPLKPVTIVARGELAVFRDRYNALIEALNRERADMRRTNDLIINSLAALAQRRDNETSLHVVRTQKYMETLVASFNRLYPTLRLDDQLSALMVQAAPLHDIGKIALPDSVLGKVGELSEGEAEAFQRHTLFGRDALETARVGHDDDRFLATALAIVRSHHERWDGTGYPDRLMGESIPVEARFMAVADAYDELTTECRTREAYSHDVAVEIIRDARGTQFDPRVVDAFLVVAGQFREIALTYRDAVEPEA